MPNDFFNGFWDFMKTISPKESKYIVLLLVTAICVSIITASLPEKYHFIAFIIVLFVAAMIAFLWYFEKKQAKNITLDGDNSNSTMKFHEQESPQTIVEKELKEIQKDIFNLAKRVKPSILKLDEFINLVDEDPSILPKTNLKQFKKNMREIINFHENIVKMYSDSIVEVLTDDQIRNALDKADEDEDKYR